MQGKTMSLNEYQHLASRTMNTKLPHEARAAMLALGVAGEAGEVADYLKKVLFHAHPMDVEKLKKELGDVLWYVANLAREFSLDLGDVADANVKKLLARYPVGFSPQASMRRADGEANDQDEEYRAGA
jgi:NTP pyrophosphatase (non-canonical NTP hydrolase)